MSTVKHLQRVAELAERALEHSQRGDATAYEETARTFSEVARVFRGGRPCYRTAYGIYSDRDDAIQSYRRGC